MFELHFLSIFAATFLAIAMGIVWYSPWFLGPLWLQVTGMTDADVEAPGQWRRLFWGGVSQFALFFVVGKLFVLLEMTRESFPSLCAYLGLVAVLLTFTITLGDRKSFGYFCISGGYTALSLVAGMSVLFFWPWA